MPVFALRQERENAVEILCEEYPRTFFSDPRRRVPLKHGIEEDIEADLAENKNSKLLGYDIDDTVEWYRSHVGYKKACSVAGNGRVDLRGAVVAKVTEAEARIAEQESQEAFAEIEARKQKQTLPKFITQPPIPVRQARALPVADGNREAEQHRQVNSWRQSRYHAQGISTAGLAADDRRVTDDCRPAGSKGDVRKGPRVLCVAPLNQCPLSGVKRTLIGRALMSAFDPKRT